MTDVGSASRASPRTLAESLRERSDDSLQALVLARPDLARPAPVDMTQLASRAAAPASISRAVDSLDAFQLGVLTTLSGLGDPVPLEAVLAALPGDASAVERVVEVLSELALVWGPPSALRVARAVLQVLAVPSRATPPVLAAPPALDGPRADQAAVDASAAAGAFEVVRRVEMLLATWAESPPAVLRSGGGVAVRDVRATAARLDVDHPQAAFLIEVAAAAGLLDQTGETGVDGAWLPSTAAAAWPERPVARRWQELTAAWLSTPRATALVGTRDERGRTINPLVPDLRQAHVATVRRLSLSALARARPLQPAPDAVAAWVGWQRPRWAGPRDAVVRATLTEAEWLGLTARGVLSSAAVQLLEGGDAAAALEPLLPRPVDAVLLQADLTAVAPGPLERHLAASLALMADVESRGGATVYRFSAASLRRVLDAGWPVAHVHAFLAEHSRTPVPQPLTYLVDDAARRHGRLRVGGAGSYLRSDDPAEIDAVVADQSLADLRLRRVAATVVLSEQLPQEVLRRLREAGHAPADDTPPGSGVAAPLPRRPGRVPRPSLRSTRLALSSDEAAAVVAAVRAGDLAAAHRPGEGIARRAATALDLLATLRDAAQSTGSVWLSYVDRTGTLSERIVDPLHVDAGWLTAYDHRTDRTRTFALHRIRQVAPLP